MSKKSEYELDYEQIGKRIRYIRRVQDVSQEELVAATNYSTSHISNIERAKTKLSLDALVRIAKALDTTPNQILAYELADMPQARVQLLTEALGGCTKEEFLDCLELVRLFTAAVRRPGK
ncbi:MAG: helix-turn-helix domain-containing protein [Ruthenibacterium sp.]